MTKASDYELDSLTATWRRKPGHVLGWALLGLFVLVTLSHCS
jgi:hypothetical protein